MTATSGIGLVWGHLCFKTHLVSNRSWTASHSKCVVVVKILKATASDMLWKISAARKRYTPLEQQQNIVMITMKIPIKEKIVANRS
jgi:hypothetical protein